MKTEQGHTRPKPSVLTTVLAFTSIAFWIILYPYAVLPMVMWVAERGILNGSITQTEATIMVGCLTIGWYSSLYCVIDVMTQKYTK